MSSQKQVQDLERQLAIARAHIASLTDSPFSTSIFAYSAPPAPLSLPVSPLPPPPLPLSVSSRTPDSRPGVSFAALREHLSQYNRGVFKPPAPFREAVEGRVPHSAFDSSYPVLPPRAEVDKFLAAYHQTIHPWLPIFHWPTFLSQVDHLYGPDGGLVNVSLAWCSTFFAVLAYGARAQSLHGSEARKATEQGRKYLTVASSRVDLFNDAFDIDHCRAALLVAIFLVELNCTSAAWTWISCAVRQAQDIGLHREPDRSVTNISPMEAELRRRVWWAIYVWDRIMAAELGRPYLVVEDDCDVAFPAPVDCASITPQRIDVESTQALSVTPQLNEGSDGDFDSESDYSEADDEEAPRSHLIAQTASSAFFIPTIHVLRILTPLRQTLKSSVIIRPTLATFDGYFKQFWDLFPFLSPGAARARGEHLDAHSLVPISLMQNLRLILHRHNLTPLVSPDLRTFALDSCTAIAIETVAFISRTMINPSGMEPSTNDEHEEATSLWAAKIAENITLFEIMHMLRAALALMARGLFRHALVCVKVMSAVHDHREINIAGGVYLEGFLNLLQERIAEHYKKNGIRAPYVLEEDEEMIALVSCDLQATSDAWIWVDDASKSSNASGMPSREVTTTSSASAPPPASTAGLKIAAETRPHSFEFDVAAALPDESTPSPDSPPSSSTSVMSPSDSYQGNTSDEVPQSNDHHRESAWNKWANLVPIMLKIDNERAMEKARETFIGRARSQIGIDMDMMFVSSDVGEILVPVMKQSRGERRRQPSKAESKRSVAKSANVQEKKHEEENMKNVEMKEEKRMEDVKIKTLAEDDERSREIKRARISIANII